MEILLQRMHSSGILRFDDTINDMDFFTRLKYTTKGPHSLGGKNSNNISIRYRGIHPSYLGNIDLLVCGNKWSLFPNSLNCWKLSYRYNQQQVFMTAQRLNIETSYRGKI